ncbi:MAG TPA: ABC transporter permease [Cyclobacteriaceae bacterium]
MYKLIVDANKPSFGLNFKELWAYRDLILILIYRDLRVRYTQTFLGLSWAIIQPLATLLIFTMVFERAIGIDTGDIPYPLFALCGMSAWTYFAFVLNNSGNSIISSQEMIKKIYFPRLIIPLSKSMVGLVDFIIALLLIGCFMIFYGITPGNKFLYLSIFIALTIISALSVGIWISALTIRYRDLQHVVPFLVQFGLYATPVGYPSELIVKNLPDWAVTLFYLNPMAGIVEGFRWTILGGSPPSVNVYYSFGVAILLFISGLYFFKKVERVMADII